MEKNLNVKEAFNLASQHYQKKNYQVAINLYNEILKVEPNHVVVFSNLGLAFNELGEHQKAIDCFNKAIELNSNYVNAHNNLGLIF